MSATTAPPGHTAPGPVRTTASAPSTASRDSAPPAATGEQKTTRIASAAASALVSTAGLASLIWTVRSLYPLAQQSHAEAALLAWVLLAAAALGALLCAYLMLVWTLACAALMLGPASRTGSAVVGTLRLIAPQLARRLTMSAAIATTATGLVLAPAVAHEPAPEHADSDSTPVGVAAHALGSLTPAAPVAGEHPDRSVPSTPEEQGELPALGWGQQDPDTTSDPRPQHETPTRDDRTGTASPVSSETLVVRPGESLWSITDDLLGPGPDGSAEIAAAWPSLYEANKQQIGQDPNHLVPGQELIVPASLSTQEES